MLKNNQKIKRFNYLPKRKEYLTLFKKEVD